MEGKMVALDYNTIKEQIEKIINCKGELYGTDHLIEMGLDSLQLMRLVNTWRKNGYKVTFAELIEKPYLDSWWDMLKKYSLKENKDATQKINYAKVKNSYEQSKQDGFPLTDVQYAYWVGRGEEQVLGGIGCHAYIELEGANIEIEKLSKAWELLCENHSMLKAVFLKEGKQKILEKSSNKPLRIHDFSKLKKDDADLELQRIRDRLSHRKLEVETGEVAGLEMSLMAENKHVIHFDIDLLVADVQSISIIMRDLAKLYEGKEIEAQVKCWRFEDYLKQKEKLEEKKKKEDEVYWKLQLKSFPKAPELPLKQKPEQIKQVVFKRRIRTIKSDIWKRVQEKGLKYRITPAMLLLTLYGEVLDKWSENSRFLINIPLFNRNTEDFLIENVVSDFTNILLLPMEFEGNCSFVERATQVQSKFHECVAYSNFSGVEIQRELAKNEDGIEQVAPVVFACNLGIPLIDKKSSLILGEKSYMISQTPQVWLDFQIYENEDFLELAWDSVEDLFPEKVIDDMLDFYERSLNKLAESKENWEKPIGEEKLIFSFEKINYSNTLHGEVFEAAKKFPERVALVCTKDGTTITYKELVKNVLKLANLMKRRNVTYGDVVAISLERGINQVFAVLAILSLGAIYVPIGLNQPKERKRVMQKKANVSYILTEKRNAKELDLNKDIEIILIEEYKKYEVLNDKIEVDNHDLAYIIYTSGSTGEPKGVAISHRSALNTIVEVNKLCKVDENDSLLSVSNLDFDLSVYDIFGILREGATLYLIDEENSKNAQYWAEVVNKNNITLWNSVPTLLDMLLIATDEITKEESRLRIAMLSGDWIDINLPKRLKKLYSNSKILAMGGATEAAIWSNYQWVNTPVPDCWNTIPYGRPLRGQLYRIVDKKGRDVPFYKAGELWIGGEGVSKGYCGNLEITNESFIEHNGIRWYKTGDYGRIWRDGTIEFLGRRDTQVKIRGHRIELSEIQIVIKQFKEIKEAVILVNELDSKNRQLVAVVTFYKNSENVLENIKEELRNILPSYMQPNRWIILDKIPVSSNGKVYREKLLNILKEDNEEDIRSSKNLNIPMKNTEIKVLEICKKVFKLQTIKITDHFFEIGGDSLLGTKFCMNLAKEFKIQLSIGEVFKKPILKDLSNYIELNKSDRNLCNEEEKYFHIDNENQYESYPLTSIQKAYCIGRDSGYGLGGISSQFYFEMDVKGLDISLLNRALQRLIDYHEVLRSTINKNNLTQKVLEKSPFYKIKLHDFSNLNEMECKAELHKFRELISRQVMDISSWPLFDIQCSKISNENYRIHISFDNMILDGWSIFYLMRQWGQLYKNPEMPLKTIKASFRDYVIALEKLKETEVYEKDKNYWMNRIKTMPQVPELPLKENPEKIYRPKFRRLQSVLSSERWSKLKKMGTELGLTPTILLISAFSEVLSKWSGNKRFLLNLTSFNRRNFNESIEELVGDFTSLIFLEVDGTNKDTFAERANQIQTQLREDMSHTLFDGVDFQRELAKEFNKSRTNIAPIVFTSTLGIKEDSREKWIGKVNYSITQTPQVWLDHQVQEIDGELFFNWDIVEGLFPEGCIEEMFKAYKELLNRLIDHEELWRVKSEEIVKAIDLSERRKANETKKNIKVCTLHELFYKNAETYPNNIAIKTDYNTITYRELRFYTRELMLKLNHMGVKKGDHVAIVMKKGAEEIIGALAIISLGAVYIPIDANTPQKRWREILKESNVSYVLVQSHINSLDLLKENFNYIEVDKWLNEVEYFKEVDEKVNYDEFLYMDSKEDLAYIIYTSGTTGVPKGVMMDHKAAMNTILDINERFNMTPSDSVFALSNMNFDLSVYDVFGMLSCGGTIVIPDDLKRKEPKYWISKLKEERITVWNTVPAFMQMLMDYMEINSSSWESLSLKTVLLSGDWIPLDLPNKIKKRFNGSKVIGLGGATEAAIWSNYHECNEIYDSWKSIPYGKPLSNQRFYILDEDLNETPNWVSGKLFIAGDGLSRGYYKDKEKTNEKFIYHKELKEVIYDTGDYGRYWIDGTIEFLGRRDNQIKIKGHRVELGEIEAAICSLDNIWNAFAFYNKQTSKIHVAIKLSENLNLDNIREKISEYIKQILPSYELPSYYCLIDEIPVNSNGKVNRKAIEKVIFEETIHLEKKSKIRPNNELERLICKIWTEILKTNDISINDDFFELGGDSLKAVRICGYLESIGFKVSIQDLFDASNIKLLAEKIGNVEKVISCKMDGNKYYSEGTI